MYLKIIDETLFISSNPPWFSTSNLASIKGAIYFWPTMNLSYCFIDSIIHLITSLSVNYF